MSKRKLAIIFLAMAIFLNAFIIGIINVSTNNYSNIKLNIELSADKEFEFQVFYSNSQDFIESNSVKNTYIPDEIQNLQFSIPINNKYLRFDFGDKAANIAIKKIYIKYKNYNMSLETKSLTNTEYKNLISNISLDGSQVLISTQDIDPYVVINIESLDISTKIYNYENRILQYKKLVICSIIDLLLIFIFVFSNKLLDIPLDLYRNRNLVFYLAKNDFKTKYAGSYFGVFWAFVQPVITIVLYWFVFQVGFRSSLMNEVPFVLWLIAGLVPWFYYSDVISSATNCLLEYSYLVKKVVFNISILPMVKVVSSLFVHLFFVCFTILVFLLYGYYPTIYMIQILYYVICSIFLVLAVSYITSSLVLFFRDLGQIINIYLQIAMWMTPIMWNYNMVPKSLLWIFKINPMYYIVDGYRDSLINNIWFFEKLDYTVYFWLFIVFSFFAGTLIFKRLKPHFADVI